MKRKRRSVRGVERGYELAATVMLGDLFDAIDSYARAYATLENLQRLHPRVIPVGDQKTGVIAEFYARCFAEARFSSARLDYGTASEHAWDIRVVRDGFEDLLIQVKAVSEHSRTSRLSPLHHGWHELWLMRLNRELQPDGFWIVDAKDVSSGGRTLKGRTMPSPGRLSSGSVQFRRRRDETASLVSLIREIRASNQR